MKRVVYFIIKHVTWVSVRVFFSRVEVVGAKNIPRNKPIVFAPNHQNAFLDAFLVGCTSPVGIHYLTRADVFDNPFRWFMEALQMMPIYRIRDGFGQLSQNAGVFEACRQLFSQNKSILMFPEGGHGEEYFLRPLTKGVARLACESRQMLSDADLWIQPVGLNYFDLRKPRRKAIVVFGEPIRVQDYMETYREQKAKALKALRDDIRKRLADCMIIPERDEFYDQKAASLTRENESLSYWKLKEKIALVRDYPPKRKPMPVFGAVGRILGIANFPPLWATGNVLKKRVKDVVFTSSIKWGMGLFLFPIWWLVLYGLTTAFLGAKAGFMVVCGTVVLLYLRQEFIKMAN